MPLDIEINLEPNAREELIQELVDLSHFLQKIEAGGFVPNDSFIFTKSQDTVLKEITEGVEKIHTVVDKFPTSSFLKNYLATPMKKLADIDKTGYTDPSDPTVFSLDKDTVFEQLDSAVQDINDLIDYLDDNEDEDSTE